MRNLWKKYKSFFFYAVFGVLTTVINIFTYVVCFNVLGVPNVPSTIIAWILAVAFAYITNKLWVFNSKSFVSSVIWSELWKFVSCRLVTGFLDLTIMFVGVDLLHGPSTLIKICSNIAVIILNYVFSKFVIFRSKSGVDMQETNSSRELITIIKACIKNAFFIVYFFAITLIVLLESPSNPFSTQIPYTDSRVFKYIAYVIQRGGMPYRDSFDHKGPLLYVLNYLGNLISIDYGIWYIEFGFFLVTLIFMYKIASLFTTKFAACLLVPVSIFPIFQYFDGGNMTEEYAMLFISCALLIFLDYFLNQRINNLRLIICGFCFGGVFLLRPNMVSVWIVFCLAVLIYSIWKEKTISWKFLGLFMVGFGIIMIPFMIWLLANDAFADFFDAYIVYNFAYSARATVISKYQSLSFYINDVVIITCIASLVFLLRRKRHTYLNAVYIIYLVVTLALICMSGQQFGHYGMILLPSYIYPISAVIHYLNDNIDSRNVSCSFLLLVIILISVFPTWKTHMDKTINILDTANNYGRTISVDDNISAIVDTIRNGTDKNEKIEVIGNFDYIYYASERLSATRYSYQSSMTDEMKNEHISKMMNNPPRMVIMMDINYDYYLSLFPTINNYDLVLTANEIGVYRIKE